MALKHVQETYDALGAKDPLYAVLSFPGMEGNRWDPEAFFARGRDEIDTMLAKLADQGRSPKTGRALDFGCGVGRLSQALATHFDQVDGVDISTSMIAAARDFNRFGERCHYHVNTTADLSLFPEKTFDFIYSNITLQHIPPEASECYIGEFIRILKPGGLALFQVPSGPRRPRSGPLAAWNRFRSGPLRRTWKRLRGKAPVEFHSVHRDRVIELVDGAGGQVLERWRDGFTRRSRESYFYLATRPVV